MGAEAESNEEKTTAVGGGATVRSNKVSDIGGAEVGNGKLSHGEEKKSPTSTAIAGGKKEGLELKGMLNDDDIASTLAAASEKLQKAHRNENSKQKMQKKRRKPSVWRCVAALYPKRVFAKLRDLYVNGCLMAADKSDFADLATGAPAMYYADTAMSRNASQRRDREREEMMQVSLSRQQSRQSQSANMSRNASTRLSGLSRNASNGFSGGLSRNASTGLSGLNRQTSRRTPLVGSSPSRKNSELFSAGRASFIQQHQNSASSLSRFGETNAFSLNSNGAALSKTEFRPGMNINRPIKEEVHVGNTPGPK